VGNFIRAGLIALALAAAPAAASASIIVDTGTPVAPTESWSLFGESIPVQGQYLAARFDLSRAALLTNLEGYVGGDGGAFTISVAADAGAGPDGDTPGATLFAQQAHAGFGEGAWSGVRHVSWSLDAGTYWVVFSVDPGHGDTLGGYMPNNAPNPTGAEAFLSIPGDTWRRADDLDFGVRINDDVPEPASWALMIAGFGLAGCGLRVRKVTAAAN
jgi:hypothetical protein